MHAFDVLGDPVRRRILELLATGEHTSGQVVEVISAEFGITQPAVSQHLRVLRDNGFAAVRAEGTRRIYSVDPSGVDEAEQWLTGLRAFWSQRLDALDTELARGRSARRAQLGTELARGRRARRAPTDPTPESGRTPDP